MAYPFQCYLSEMLSFLFFSKFSVQLWLDFQSLKEGRHFPGHPVVKISPSSAGSASLIPSKGTKIPLALRPRNQNIRQKLCCNKFNEDFKKWSTSKKKNLEKEGQKWQGMNIIIYNWPFTSKKKILLLGDKVCSLGRRWIKELLHWLLPDKDTPEQQLQDQMGCLGLRQLHGESHRC